LKVGAFIRTPFEMSFLGGVFYWNWWKSLGGGRTATLRIWRVQVWMWVGL
jgi:hypothetical protein